MERKYKSNREVVKDHKSIKIEVKETERHKYERKPRKR